VTNIYDGAEIYQQGTTSYVGSLVGVSYGGTVNVYGGKGTSAKGGFIAMTSGGTINVYGGDWTANTNGTVANDNYGVLISQYDNATYPSAVTSIVNVTGGTFKGGYNCYSNVAEKAFINITGGNFNADPAAYVVEGYVTTEKDGIFTVAEKEYAATIGDKKYETLLDAVKAAAGSESAVVINVLDGNHTMPTGADVNLQGKTLTFKGTKNAVIDASVVDERDQYVTGATLTFEGLTLNFSKTIYMGFANTTALTYKDCVINGLQCAYGAGMTKFENCDLNSDGAEHCLWTWGGQNISFTGCDFTYGDRAVNCYGEGVTTNVSFDNCTFTKVESDKETTGAIETNSSALVALNLVINNCKVTEGDLWWVSTCDSLQGEHTEVVLDGVKIVKRDSEAAIIVPDTGIKVENTEIDEEVAKEIVDEVTTSVSTNTALEADGFAASDIADIYTENVDVPTTDVNVSSEVKIVPTAVEIKDNELTKITFDVTPVLIVSEEGKEDVEIEVKQFNEPITFRLPIPSNITSSHVIIEHEDVNIGKYEVKGEGDHKYVELKSANFSEYAAIPAAATTLANGCVTANGRITAEAKNINATESVVLKLYSTAAGTEPVATSTLAAKYFENGPAIYSTLTTNFMLVGTSSSWTTVWAEGHPIAWAEPDRIELYIDGEKVAESIFTTNSADTIEANKIAWSEVGGVNPAPAAIGKIGYKNLQAAVDAVKNGEIILLNKDVTHTEGATINNGVQFTIDGQNATFTNTIVLGLNQNVTIKNIQFVNISDAEEFHFIKTNSKNSNPVLMVDGCTFTGKEGTTTVAVMTQHPKDVTIKNCTGTKLHSLLQNTNGHKVTVENVEVEASEGGLNLNNVITAVIKNVKITSAGEYGIRLDGGNASNITVEDVTISADIPVYVRVAVKDGWNLNIEGENELTAEEGYPVIAINKDKKYTVSDGEVVVTQTDKKVTVVINDEKLVEEIGENYTEAIKGAVFASGNKYYTTMPKAEMSVGTVINAGAIENTDDGSYINFEITDMFANESVQIKLYSGETLLSTTDLVKTEGNIGAQPELSAKVEITDESSSWETKWEAGHPNAGAVPTKAELYIDGKLAAETNEIGIYDMPNHVENWADIEGVSVIELTNGETVTWHATLADALNAAKDGATVKLYESKKVLASAGEVTGNKTVTITGKATFDWSKGFLFVGRGSNEGDGTLIFDNAEIASASQKTVASYGFNVSSAEKDAPKKCNGTLIIKNSTIETDYIQNRGTVEVDNSKLTVIGYFATSGRPANETPDGKDAVATITIKNNSNVEVKYNSQGIGHDGKGVLNLENSTLTAMAFPVYENNGTFNVSGESKIVAAGLTGTVNAAADTVLVDSTVGGTLKAPGNLTFKGENKVGKFATGSNSTYTIGEDASLAVTGTDRITVGHGNTFNITGSVENAKTADKNETKVSFSVPGASITGSGATFNVTNAYISMGNTSSKNNAANGKFEMNFTNSIVEFTNQFTLSAPTNNMAPEFVVNFKDSVVSAVAKICIAAPNSNVKMDNSVVTTENNLHNSGNLTLVNGSELTANTIQFGENGGNAGVITVDNSKLTVNASTEGHAFDGNGTGKVILVNNAKANITYIKKMAIELDATSKLTVTKLLTDNTVKIDAAAVAAAEFGYTAKVIVGDASAITAEQITLVNGLGVNVTIDDTGVTLTRKSTVAANGNDDYATVQEAIYAAAANSTDKTVKLLCDVTENTTIIVNKNVTLDLNGFDLTAPYVVAFAGSHVKDGNTEKGLLKVPQGNIMLQANNAQMPVWNETNGYYFTGMKLSYDEMTAPEGLVFKSSFKPSFGKPGADALSFAKQYFVDDEAASDNGLQIIIRLSWTGSSGNKISQDFLYTDALVKDVYAASNKVFTLGITSLPTENEVSVKVVVASDTGAEFVSNGWTYNNGTITQVK